MVKIPTNTNTAQRLLYAQGVKEIDSKRDRGDVLSPSYLTDPVDVRRHGRNRVAKGLGAGVAAVAMTVGGALLAGNALDRNADTQTNIYLNSTKPKAHVQNAPTTSTSTVAPLGEIGTSSGTVLIGPGEAPADPTSPVDAGIGEPVEITPTTAAPTTPTTRVSNSGQISDPNLP